MSDSNSRRHFMKQLGLGAMGTFLTPYERLADSIMGSFIQQAQAQETNNVTSRYYINFFFPSGPHRVAFDQWLRTNANDPAIIYNPMMGTAYTKSGNNVGFEYKTFTAENGLMVPHLFSQTVNTSTGAKPLSLILKHMLAIRGFSTGIDGHALNASIQQMPLSGAPSILALPSDASKAPYAAVRYRAGGPFVSHTGKAVSELNVDKPPLQALFESLQPSVESLRKVKTLKDRNAAAFDRFDAQLKALSQADTLGAKALKANMDNARSILKKGVGDIDGFWNQAVARYKTVIENAIRTTNIPGISDSTIIPANNAQWNISDLFRANVNKDLRDSVSTGEIEGYAESLAMCEYLINGNFTSAMHCNVSGLSRMSLDYGSQFPFPTMVGDTHNTGAGVTVLTHNAYYRAILAGVLELKEKLEQKAITSGGNAWNQTVIHFSGDFARTARTDGAGTDHGWDHNCNSIISGAFSNGPFCVGNVAQGVTTGGYSGSIAESAPIAGYAIPGKPGAAFGATHVANILGLPTNPYANVAPPAARLVGNNLVVNLPGKVVVSGS